MKVKLFIVSLFILISIFNIEMGNHYMPLWLQIIIEIISVFITVYSLLYFISNSKKEIESQILSLKDIFSKNFEEIKSLNIRQKTEIVDILNTYSKDILKQIYDTNESLSVVISSESNQIKDQLSSSEKVITKAVETSTNSAFTTLAGLIENLNKVSHDRVESLRQLSKEQHEVLLQRVDGISLQGEVIQKNICSSVSDLSSKSDALGESITLVSNGINEQLTSSEAKMSELIITSLNTLGTSLDASIDTAKKISNDGVESLRQLSKEQHEVLLQKVDGVSQQGEVIQKNICSSVSDLSSKSEALGESITLVGNGINEQLTSSEAKMSELIITSLNTLGTSLDASIDTAKNISNDGVESLRQLSKEQHEVLLQRVDGVSLQGEVIQKNICSSVSDLSSKSDALGESITLVSNSINEHISSTDKKMLSIEKQNSSIVEHITAKEKDCSISKAILSDIKNQYEVLNKNVTSIQFKAQSIEESVNLLSEDKLDSKIIDSIGTLISEFQATYKSSVSDVNNTLLDTQIAQEATTNELEKLQILLRTLLNSFDENPAKNVSEEPKAVNLVVKNSMPSSEKNSEYKNVPRSQIQKRQTQAKTSTPIGITQNPNRTENILDNETGNLVINQYKDGKVVKSTMKDSKGHIMYELEYVNERIVRSRNFNNKGQLNVEQTFYANGQVHYRNEYTPNGRITTEFDFNGKKK